MENQQEVVFVPYKIREQAEAACRKLIPEKSKENVRVIRRMEKRGTCFWHQ